MFVYDFSFRSLTAAQDGRSVLQNAGVFSQLARAPKQIAEQGCGYVLEVESGRRRCADAVFVERRALPPGVPAV